MRWVVAQVALWIAIVVSWFVPPRFPDGVLDAVGVVLALAGIALAAWGYRTLGPVFTPMPEPRGGIVTGGPYRYLRHPMYVGGVAFFGGLSLVFTVLGLVLTGALALLWIGKARLESRLLGR